MRKALLLARREYAAAVRTKAFIISLILVPIFMGGGIFAVQFLEDQVDTTDKRVAVVDRSGLLANYLVQAARERNSHVVHNEESGDKVQPAYIVEVVPPRDDADAQRLELSDRVRAKELHAFVEIGPSVLRPTDNPEGAWVRYHSHNTMMDDTRRWFRDPINSRLQEMRLAEANLEPAEVQRLMSQIPIEGLGLVKIDKETGEIGKAERSNELLAIFLPMGVMMLMFMVVMTSAGPLLNSVLEEKMQRIAEVMLGSMRPFELMMGKLIGTVAVTLTVVSLYGGAAIIAANQAGVGHHIPYHVLPWFVVYQIAAVFMFGALFIAIGATCSDLKEAQSQMMPVMLVVMLPMFVWILVVKAPLSSFSTWISLFPPCTPMLMLLRQSTPVGIPLWQPIVGLIGVLLFTLLSVWAAGRIFRVGLLMQGKAPNLRDLARWAIRG